MPGIEVPSQKWHRTHGCHKREFSLRFGLERSGPVSNSRRFARFAVGKPPARRRVSLDTAVDVRTNLSGIPIIPAPSIFYNTQIRVLSTNAPASQRLRNRSAACTVSARMMSDPRLGTRLIPDKTLERTRWRAPLSFDVLLQK